MPGAALQSENTTLVESSLNLNDTYTEAPSGGSSAQFTSIPSYLYVTVPIFYGLIFILGIVGEYPI